MDITFSFLVTSVVGHSEASGSWIYLACRLGLDKSQIEDIIQNYQTPTQQCVQALKVFWTMDKDTGEEEKINCVVGALKKENLHHIAGKTSHT